MEYLLEDILYESPECGEKRLLIDAAEVGKRLAKIAEDRDLGRYIL